MLTLEEIRAKYPQYNNKSDEELLSALHTKFYSQIPREEFFAKFNLPAQQSMQPKQSEQGYFARNLSDITSGLKRGVETAADIGTGFKGGVEKITHGLIQPLAERGLLGEHVQQGFRPMVERNQQELQAAEERSPYGAGFGKFLGSAGVRAPAYAALGGTLPALGAIGGTYGAATLPEGNESRLGNAAREAAVDVFLGGALKAAKALPGFAKSFSGSANAKKILADKAAVQQQYNKAYNSLFDKAKAYGLGDEAVKAPKLNVENVIDNSSKIYNKSLKDFIQRPTLEGAHRAQSDLGKFVEKLNRVERSHTLTSTQYKALEEAINAQKKIRGTLFSELNKRGGKDLALEYQNLTKGYRQDVAPYLGNRTLKALEKGEMEPATAARKLAKDEKFNLATSNKYPELQRSLLVDSLKGALTSGAAKGLGLGVAGTYSAKKLIDFLKE